MPKPFLTFDAQISYLENDKNLVIQDHDYAKTMLKQIGYFSLIGGYKAPLRIQRPGNTGMVRGSRTSWCCIILTRICGSFF